ncbi:MULTISPECIES: hypothetical protein [Planktothricoides]|uniref:Uncharacterized protein n=1 Tax=Planktothricoides raciborskii GIHE-MW2 TaxID=2792601 RepID=A0AAU8J8L6_9CYAN|nr:hypothetical protein [Planktothricoides sp. SR001]
MTVYQSSQPVAQLTWSDFKDEQLQQINPKVVAAIQAIQAERMGKEPIAWRDFSSHNQS